MKTYTSDQMGKSRPHENHLCIDMGRGMAFQTMLLLHPNKITLKPDKNGHEILAFSRTTQ